MRLIATGLVFIWTAAALAQLGGQLGGQLNGQFGGQQFGFLPPLPKPRPQFQGESQPIIPQAVATQITLPGDGSTGQISQVQTPQATATVVENGDSNLLDKLFKEMGVGEIPSPTHVEIPQNNGTQNGAAPIGNVTIGGNQPAANPTLIARDPAQKKPYVKLRFLDKVTARLSEQKIPVGGQYAFGTLRIRPWVCYQTPPSEPPESAAFLEITDHLPDKEPKRAFSSWMFASSPALNGLEHAVYDVWVVGCENEKS